MKKLLFLAIMTLESILLYAHDFCVDNIYYSISGENAIVTYESNLRGNNYHNKSNLVELYIPQTVEYGGKTYFVTSIDDGAFYDCYNLTSAIIGSNVVSIGRTAFAGCTALTSVTIPEGVMAIGNGVFRGCSNLKSIAIPKSVVAIGSYVFMDCTSLSSVTIPEGITNIYGEVFQNCTSLTSIDIPNSVTSIGDYAFRGCSGLNSFVIGNNVTSIGNYAFSSCNNLASVTIGNSVTSIGNSAFSNCLKLENVYCYGKRYPMIQGDAFIGSYIDYVTLHVPAQAIKQYKAHEVWGQFMEIEPLTDEEEQFGASPVLTIIQADNGSVSIDVPKGSVYTLKLSANNGWKIHSVSFNDEEVTNLLKDINTFITPSIVANSTLCIAFEIDDEDKVQDIRSSSIKIQGTSYGAKVTGAEVGDNVMVYTEDGVLVKSVPVVNQQTEIDLKKNGLYIIKVGSKVVKMSH